MLPVYNQADHLEKVVESYLDATASIDCSFDWILVPNGCRDDSVAVCNKLVERHQGVRCEESPIAGWGAAVLHGLGKADGDLLCYTNLARTSAADLQLLILYAIANPGSVVKAERKIRESFVRRSGSLLYNLQCRALFDLSYWDINGTPKLFPSKFSRLLEMTRKDDLVDLEFCVICREEGYPFLEVPILSSTRHGGKSTTKLWS